MSKPYVFKLLKQDITKQSTFRPAPVTTNYTFVCYEHARNTYTVRTSLINELFSSCACTYVTVSQQLQVLR